MTETIDKREELTRRYSTYVKSGAGAVVISLVTTLIYLIRLCVTGNAEFWLSTYITQFMVKSSSFVPEYSGNVPKPASIAVIAVCFIAMLIPTVLSQKNSKWLKISLALFSIDTLMNIVCVSLNVFHDFTQNSFIDIIFHLFILTFLIMGVYGSKKLDEIEGKD